MNYSRYYYARVPKDLNVLQLAVVVLNTFGLHSLKMASLGELMHVWHRQNQAIELKAAMEQGALSNARRKLRKITSSKMAGQWIVRELRITLSEHRCLVFEHEKRDHQEEVSSGGLNSAVAHPREIFREAVRFRRLRHYWA